MSIAAILLAGGRGARVERDVNKVYLPVRGREILEYSLETLDALERVEEVVLVVRGEDRPGAERLLATVGTKVAAVVEGGPTRTASEQAGLDALAGSIEDGRTHLVAVHDGARPFADLELWRRVLDAAEAVGGAVPGLAVEGPLYEVREDGGRLLDPGSLHRVQTPQAFRAAPLLAAFRAAARAGFEGADTAETVGRFADLPVALVAGDPRNLKVTYVEDLFTAEDLATGWGRGGWRA